MAEGRGDSIGGDDKGYWVSFWSDENVLILVVVMVAHVTILKITDLHTVNDKLYLNKC